MANPSIKITAAKVIDLRVPTSDQMLGSDPFHKKPDYSSAVLHLGARGILGGAHQTLQAFDRSSSIALVA